MRLFEVTSTEFFCAIRAVLAGSLAAFFGPNFGTSKLESWMKPDSGFDPAYDNQDPDGGRGGRTHRCQIPFADSSKLQNDGADRSSGGGSPREGDVWHLPERQEQLWKSGTS